MKQYVIHMVSMYFWQGGQIVKTDKPTKMTIEEARQRLFDAQKYCKMMSKPYQPELIKMSGDRWKKLNDTL